MHDELVDDETVVHFRTEQSNAECEQAMQLALAVFSGASSEQGHMDSKRVLWHDETFSMENIVLALSKAQKVVVSTGRMGILGLASCESSSG